MYKDHTRRWHDLAFFLMLSTFASTGAAQSSQAQYEADLKLCADEPVAEARLQCRRDARLVYDKALANVKPPAPAAMASPPPAAKITPPGSAPTAVMAPAPVINKPALACMECAKVTAVNLVEKPGESNATGMIAGGLAGAVLGRQIGGGLGKDLSTLAGAAGGAYAGKKIQENMNTSKVWRVSVSFTDGRTGIFDFAQDPGFSMGDAVRQNGETLVRQ